MSLWSRARQTVLLVSAEQAENLPTGKDLTVVLSAHLVRYAVLPWSAALASEEEWLAFARHSFSATYGAPAANWTCVLSAAGRRKARVACAIDAALLGALRANPRVISVQPGLMAAFNGRRDEFGDEPGWFVVPEAGRLTLGLIAGGEWKLVRTRRAPEDWRAALPDLIAREAAAGAAQPCGRIVIGGLAP